LPGTGAIGIEALSRGAAWVTFVEADRRAQRLIEENLTRCGVDERYAIIRAAADRAMKTLAGQAPYDLVLLDPPYDRPSSDALAGVDSVIAADGLVVLEHARRSPAPERAGQLQRTRELRSGRQRADLLHMPTLAVYPGSFDPITNGHVDIITRGARLFDHIIVAIAANAEKSPLFSMSERIEIARSVFREAPNVEVDSFDGLLVDYVHSRARRPSSAVCGPSRTSSTSSHWR